MKLKLPNKIILVLLFIFSLVSQKTYSQCFQIESILVDACGADEGLNEMVRFKVGPTAINTSNMTVQWPVAAVSWQGLIKNATTASKVATLNADIVAAGGCGQLIEPTAGVLPANATVILVTSFNLDTALNSFGALTETIYIIFQNNPAVTTGHFTNFGDGMRTLKIKFGSACTDTVTYNRALLTTTTGANAAADGATVLFTPAGVATYVNYGCSAPVNPFTIDAGLPTMSACAGTTIALAGTAVGQQSVAWSAASGTFSSPSTLATNFTIPNSASGQVIVITLTATNSCGATITDTINLTVTASVTPTFSIANTICAGSSAPVFPTTSINGITGTWNPSTISNTANGTYVFTPNAGQCATSFTLNVTVSSSITPTFSIASTICAGSNAPTLPTTSTNGITGTWNPSTISNTANGTYVFTPNAGQCASSFTLNVTVSSSITPTFSIASTICAGSSVPVLPPTSTNGITGTWNPSTISNAANGAYVFTPNAGQCATSFTLNVTVSSTIAPIFSIASTICAGSNAPTLPTTSTNGIIGTWNPSTISNTANGTYVFTPNAGQCATSFTLNVTVSSTIAPIFSIASTICAGSNAPTLPTTSTNGIIGTWNPSTISNTANGTYVFTPNAGQCATSFTLNVTVSSSIAPTFSIANTICAGSSAPVLPTTSTNGITGTWNPSTISNSANGTYVFTPNAGQCATSFTLNVTVSSSIAPTFAIASTICAGSSAPTLPTTSTNGITGTWNPSTISNTANGTYVFTPNAGQCATSFTLNVTVSSSITPTFSIANTLCTGSSAPVLPTTSTNGIIGTWNPSTISNTANGTYVFTPNAGQCATVFTLEITITNFEIEFNQNCKNGDFIVTVSPLNSSFNPENVTYLWKNSQGNVIGMNESQLNISELMDNGTVVFPATYEVTVSNSDGCSVTSNVIVYGAFCRIPKGISPNNDGDNDNFDLTGLGVDEIYIYNRYGTEVYHKKNYINEWNGQSDKGHELPAATYFYMLRKSNNEKVTGWVYVIR